MRAEDVMAFRVPVKRVAQLALMMFAAGELSAAAADVLVLRVDGPRAPNHYRVGSRHADNAVFELRPGDMMTVLAASGTRQWRGPGFYSLVAPARPLILNGQVVRVQTGVVRGEPPQPGVRPTDVWEYDITQEGRLCVARGARPFLWLPRSTTATAVTIRAQNGASARIAWPAGTYRMPWPENLPLTEGAAYVVESSRSAQPVRITAATLPADAAAGTSGLALQLVGQRCVAQLSTLIATRVDETAPLAAAEPPARGNRPTR
jgi:hypothetical protein